LSSKCKCECQKAQCAHLCCGRFTFLTFPSTQGKLLAQDFEGFRTHFGLRVGPSANRLIYYADQTRKSSRILGYSGAVFIDTHVKGWLFIQPELNYSTEGGLFKASSFTTKTRENLQYVGIPVLAEFKNPTGNISFYLGPEYRRLIKAKETDYKITGKSNSNVHDQFKSSGWLLDLGLNVTGNRGLGVDIRWTIGLTNMLASNSKFVTYDDVYFMLQKVIGLTTESVQLSLFYKL